MEVFTRVVRFTGVTPERMRSLTSRIEAAGGPPSGVTTMGLKVLFDEAQGTAVVLQYFATAHDMEEAAKVLARWTRARRPGERASVDACELKLDLDN